MQHIVNVPSVNTNLTLAENMRENGYQHICPLIFIMGNQANFFVLHMIIQLVWQAAALMLKFQLGQQL